MADVTDAVFHEILREIGGPGLYTAEMVSAAGLARGDGRCRRLLERPRGCPSFAVQVYGTDPRQLADAALAAVDHGADVIDVNMGCPAKKITGKACGSALLRDTAHVARILAALRRALPDAVPLTVKVRLGWDDASLVFREVGRLAEELGLAGITVHGRTRRQMFTGSADWAPIRELAASLSIPVVGNGDVQTPEDAVSRLAETGCAGVMIARAALANPWIFRQLRQAFAGEPVTEPTLAERRSVLLAHHDRLARHLPAKAALHRLKVFVRAYVGPVPGGVAFRRRLSHLDDAGAFLAAVRELFDAAEDAQGAGPAPSAAA